MALFQRCTLQRRSGIVSLCFTVSLLAGCSEPSPSLSFIASSLAPEQRETGQAFENSIGLILFRFHLVSFRWVRLQTPK